MMPSDCCSGWDLISSSDSSESEVKLNLAATGTSSSDSDTLDNALKIAIAAENGSASELEQSEEEEKYAVVQFEDEILSPKQKAGKDVTSEWSWRRKTPTEEDLESGWLDSLGPIASDDDVSEASSSGLDRVRYHRRCMKQVDDVISCIEEEVFGTDFETLSMSRSGKKNEFATGSHAQSHPEQLSDSELYLLCAPCDEKCPSTSRDTERKVFSNHVSGDSTRVDENKNVDSRASRLSDPASSHGTRPSNVVYKSTARETKKKYDKEMAEDCADFSDFNTNADVNEEGEAMPDGEARATQLLSVNQSRADTIVATTRDSIAGMRTDTQTDFIPEQDARGAGEGLDVDLDSRTSELLAQAQSGFSLELPSSADVTSLVSSDVALTSSRLFNQYSVSSQTLQAEQDGVWTTSSSQLSDSVVDPIPNSHEERSSCEIDLILDNSPEPGTTCDLDTIPDEILLLCFSFLKPIELCRHVALICRRWYRLAYDCSLWKRLDVSERRMSGPQLRQLIQKVPGGIRFLDMSGLNNLTNIEMAAIAECCPELTDLDVGFVDDFNATMLESVLRACPKLSFLNVEGCRIANNEMMRTLANFKGTKVRRLNFSHCSLVDESLLLLVRNVLGITHLNIDGISWISQRVVQKLAEGYKDSLESLELDGNELSDNVVYSVSLCHRLHTLSISFCEGLTDSAVGYLLRLQGLKKLVLRKGPAFSSGCLLEFFSMPAARNLTHLDLTECQQLDDRGVKAIAHSCGSTLKTLCLSWCWDITDIGMEAVAAVGQSMVKMYLVGLHRLEGNWLPDAVDTMPHLIYVTFEQCNEVSDGIIEDAVRAKSDLMVLNYYGEIFVHSGAL